VAQRSVCGAPTRAPSNYLQEIPIKPANQAGLRTMLRINFCCA
jgi:hypothetical protein